MLDKHQHDFKIPEKLDTPSHYTSREKEAIEYIKDLGVFEDYCVGNIVKYIYRFRDKSDPVGDLYKIAKYAVMLAEELEK